MTFLWILGGVSVVAVALAATKEKHPFRRVGLSAVLGCCALGLVNVMTSWTGVGIALNFGTALITVVLGMPGVILMLALRPLL